MKFIECLQVNKYLLLLEVERRIIFFFSPIEWFSGKMILLGKPARNFSRKAFFFFFQVCKFVCKNKSPTPPVCHVVQLCTWHCTGLYCGFEAHYNGTTMIATPETVKTSSGFDMMLARANDAMVKASVPPTPGPARQDPTRGQCAEKALVMCSARFGLQAFIHLCGLYKWKNKAGPMHSQWAD